MNNAGRPLSPYLTVYRWPIMMTLSILHRTTGVALSVGLMLLVVWLQAVAAGAGAYQAVTGFMQSVPGRLLLVAWSFAFFFHLANGVRHLVWDAGYGFEKSQARASAWVVISATIVMTAAYWLAL